MWLKVRVAWRWRESKPFGHWADSLAKCKSVQKPHANLPLTPVAFISTFKYFQMLLAPPGALQNVLRLCKSNIRWFCNHQQL
jgi:hypothetical protein